MTIGVLCSGYLGFQVLDKLFDKYKVEYVFTDYNSTKIIDFCNTRKIPHFLGNPRKGNATSFTRKYASEILISANYLFIIENDIIEMGKKLAFNIHGSLLPKYRGRTPHVWSIINDEKWTGITAHIIDEGCDTGDILEQIKIPIESHDTGNDILMKYEQNYFSLITKVINTCAKGELNPRKQDETKSSYFGKRTPEDGHINWDWQKERIYNWVRAQASPYPGAFTFLNGQKITIDKIVITDYGYDYKMKNGEILSDMPILIKTPNGVIEIESIRQNIKFKKRDVLL